jgi:hypothetical protein
MTPFIDYLFPFQYFTTDLSTQKYFSEIILKMRQLYILFCAFLNAENCFSDKNQILDKQESFKEELAGSEDSTINLRFVTDQKNCFRFGQTKWLGRFLEIEVCNHGREQSILTSTYDFRDREKTLTGKFSMTSISKQSENSSRLEKVKSSSRLKAFVSPRTSFDSNFEQTIRAVSPSIRYATKKGSFTRWRSKD